MTDTPKSSRVEGEQIDSATMIVEKSVPSISESIARIVDKLVEVYLGEKDSMTISTFIRIICSYAGAINLITFYFFGYFISNISDIDPDKVKTISDFNLSSIANAPQIAFHMVLTPLMLSIMMGVSIRNGGPLRFFLLGFFLCGMMLSFASIFFPK